MVSGGYGLEPSTILGVFCRHDDAFGDESAHARVAIIGRSNRNQPCNRRISIKNQHFLAIFHELNVSAEFGL